MFLDLTDLTLEELNEKSNQLYSRLAHLSQFGGRNSYTYNQCSVWIEQIQLEIQERAIIETFDFESGTVAIIGEEIKEDPKKNETQ